MAVDFLVLLSGDLIFLDIAGFAPSVICSKIPKLNSKRLGHITS